MSLATRVSLLAACAVGLSVSMASIAAYVTLGDQLHDRMDNSLMTRTSKASDSPLIVSASAKSVSLEILGAADVRAVVISHSGNVFPPSASAWLNPSPNEIRVADGSQQRTLRTIMINGREFRAATVHIDSGEALMFAQSTDSIEKTLDRMGLVLFLVGLGGIVVAAITGLAVARSALVPVRRLSAAAEHIARTEELTPIEVTGDDELASLATSFNKMIATLAASRDRQRRLVADAGHELRTPLTSLRTNLELLALADRKGGMSAEQRDEIFSDATAQVEELSTLVGDLVELARDEPLHRTPEPLDFANIVSNAVDRVRRRGLGLTFDVELDAWWVIGEEQLLERAVTNLLDNAAKWSPSGGSVAVNLTDGVLTVSDEGSGIHESDLPMIFERFYRADDARTMPGSGLGLSIVRQAAERHGGNVTVANREPHGAEFKLTIPGHRDLDELPDSETAMLPGDSARA